MSSGVWIVEARCAAEGPDAAIALARAMIPYKEIRLSVEQVLWSVDWTDGASIRQPLTSDHLELILKRPPKSARPFLSARFPPHHFARVTKVLEALARSGWGEVRVAPESRWSPAKRVFQGWERRLPAIRKSFGDSVTPTPTPARLRVR